MHKPVLKKEVIECLNPKPGENFIDATFGEGGHSRAILEKTRPGGKILGIEADPELYKQAKEKKLERVILVNDSYTHIDKTAKEHNFSPVNGILFDLGLCNWHLEDSQRGFSFQRDQELDMRYNLKESNFSAKKIVNQWKENRILQVLKDYGEEKYSKRIADRLIKERKKEYIETTSQLKEIIEKALPIKEKNKVASLAKTFQALRIAVNQELWALGTTLPKAIRILEKEGRIAVISFHSLEDRIVKNFFRELSQKGQLEIITKKPIFPSEEEIEENPKSRSARLRVAKKRS